jgi:hypothetical protein
MCVRFLCHFVPKSDFVGLPSSRLLATLAVKGLNCSCPLPAASECRGPWPQRGAWTERSPSPAAPLGGCAASGGARCVHGPHCPTCGWCPAAGPGVFPAAAKIKA